MKEQNGITIVAMIITIIVMVILAGVAIVTAVIDGGILQKTQNAQTEYETAEELEKVKLSATEAYLAGSGVIIEENLRAALDSNIGAGKHLLDNSNSEYFEATIVGPGRKYMIYPNGKVEGPIMPDAPLGKAEIGIIAVTNSTIDGEEYSSTNPLIPAGFTAVDVGGKWNPEGGSPEIDKGLVVRDENNNEFVWVPVTTNIDENGYGLNSTDKREPDVITGDDGNSYDAVADNLIRAECVENPNDDNTVLTADDFKAELTNMYKKMAESVNKYGGFYVGRFETSKNEENPQSRRSTYYSGSGEEIRTEIVTNTVNWYDLYALNKKYSTTSVQGSMMWGSQYNAMMTWMGAKANSTGTRNGILCGSSASDVINNVYDIYGGGKEWTIEVNGSNYRIARGGSCSSSCVLAPRW